MKKIPFYCFGLAYWLVYLTGCQSSQSIEYLTTPCKRGGEPNLHVSNSGNAYLSWVEYLNDSTDVLAFSTLEETTWSAPKIVAKGTNWFVNWADFPSLVTYSDSEDKMAAHWLQKSAVGTYDYDVRIAQSKDGGTTWSKSFVPHTDGIAAEHGFVTLLPMGNNQIFATWLDGRYTKTENNSDGHDHEGQGGAMTLRAAFFDGKGQLSGEIELDDQVCDCCSTSAAQTETGVIVAYRDRLEGEIRDISIVRQIGQDWTRPRRLNADGWEIAGCPVNGPKIVSDGEKRVAVAWYTMAQDTAKVLLAVSNDAGANFGEPIRIDDGQPLGRVGLTFRGKDLFLSWLEKENVAEASIRLAKIDANGLSRKMTVTETSSARRSGFPILKTWNQQLLMAWTEVLDNEENTTIRTALVDF